MIDLTASTPQVVFDLDATMWLPEMFQLCACAAAAASPSVLRTSGICLRRPRRNHLSCSPINIPYQPPPLLCHPELAPQAGRP